MNKWTLLFPVASLIVVICVCAIFVNSLADAIKPLPLEVELIDVKEEKPQVETGETWVLKNDNPFDPVYYEAEVVDIKNGYVQYRHAGDNILGSSNVRIFLISWEKVR